MATDAMKAVQNQKVFVRLVDVLELQDRIANQRRLMDSMTTDGGKTHARQRLNGMEAAIQTLCLPIQGVR